MMKDTKLNMPRLIMVAGLPGTGKTTFAKALANKIGASHLNTDILRTEVGLRGQYDEATKKKVYNMLKRRTEGLLAEGKTVVVDGTFYLEKLRKPYDALANKYKRPVSWLIIEAPEKVVQERVSKQRKYSEADFEVYQKIKEQWEPFESRAVTIATAPLALMVKNAINQLSV